MGVTSGQLNGHYQQLKFPEPQLPNPTFRRLPLGVRIFILLRFLGQLSTGLWEQLLPVTNSNYCLSFHVRPHSVFRKKVPCSVLQAMKVAVQVVLASFNPTTQSSQKVSGNIRCSSLCSPPGKHHSKLQMWQTIPSVWRNVRFTNIHQAPKSRCSGDSCYLRLSNSSQQRTWVLWLSALPSMAP